MKTLKIYDQTRAGIIIAQNIPLVDITDNKGNPVFLFADDDGKATMANAAYAHNKPIPLADLINGLRKAKELVFQLKTVRGDKSNPVPLIELQQLAHLKKGK
jgi:hypothetical protein